MLATIMYILGGVILLVVFLGVIAPKNYHVSRSIQINRPLPEVFNYLKFLKNQDEWSPWFQKDPNIKKGLKGIDGSIGAVSWWEGNKEVGSGEQEIKRILSNETIETELRFIKPFKSTSEAYIKVEKVLPETTTVVWGFSGLYKFPMNIFMIFMNMDKAVGKDFESGLSDLKRILESE
ncbi:SRPBCC family protein [Galbibacter pacificus]|uniref:SRPBCC family protein n=1 Tax=Galbibacter pacificus TaxID=2996052 RepID=A0ABT6FUR3_9FLAO|nr:SRPBCC family protein [Galbibacter pacificus]MDG3586975.1 SRPBCC family protein [Galbibacter pacificus]